MNVKKIRGFGLHPSDEEERKHEQDNDLLDVMIEKFAAQYRPVSDIAEAEITTAEIHEAFTKFADNEISEPEMNHLLSTATEFKFEWDSLRKELCG